MRFEAVKALNVAKSNLDNLHKLLSKIHGVVSAQESGEGDIEESHEDQWMMVNQHFLLVVDAAMAFGYPPRTQPSKFIKIKRPSPLAEEIARSPSRIVQINFWVPNLEHFIVSISLKSNDQRTDRPLELQSFSKLIILTAIKYVMLDFMPRRFCSITQSNQSRR